MTYSETKICGWCQHEFVSHFSRGKYCSNNCSYLARRRVIAESKVRTGIQKRTQYTERVCSFCRSLFFSRFSSSKTCSDQCQTLYRSEAASARYKRYRANNNDYLKERMRSWREGHPEKIVAQSIKQKIGFYPDIEAIELRLIRQYIKEAIKKAGE